MGMGTELPLFFASTTRAPHLFLLLPLIFHSFNNYQLSPTVCRHCDKHGYTCSILSLPHLFPFLSFLLHASQSLSFHQLLASPTSSFMLLFQLELRGRGPTPISSPGAGGWVEPLGGDRAQGALRAQSEQQCGLQTKQMHPTPPPPIRFKHTHRIPLPHHKPEKRQKYTTPSKVRISDLTISLVGSLNSAGILVRVQPENRKHRILTTKGI